MGPGWHSLLTHRHFEGKMSTTMQLGSTRTAAYAYHEWSRPTPTLSG